MRLPNLLLLGAPKCGTSSLYQWLEEHDGITGGDDKEPFYVVDPESPFRKAESNAPDHGLEGYRRCFRRAHPTARWVLDGTTHTLYQRSAITFLKLLPETPRLLAVLRRPADRVYSSFRFSQHHLARFTRPAGFAEVRRLIESQDTAALENLIPFARSRYVLERDVAYSQYIDWLEPWQDAFGDALRVVLLEDLKATPRPAIDAIGRWLDLDPTGFRSPSLPQSNVTVQPRRPGLHRWIRGLRRWVPKSTATVAPLSSLSTLATERRRRADGGGP